MSTPLSPEITACAEALNEGAPERVEALMLAPADLRADLWPLHALVLELARAPWASKEPMVSEMRLQWWIDALETLGRDGTPPQHPIGPGLAVLRPHWALLVEMAEARRADCWPEGFEDEAALWSYLEQTSGVLYQVAGRLAGAGPDLEPRLRDFGTAAGLHAWFRAVPELEARGRQPLPDGRMETVARLAGEGLARYRAARIGAMPGRVRMALVSGWQTRGVLERVQREPARVADGLLEGSEFSYRLGRLLAAFGRF